MTTEQITLMSDIDVDVLDYVELGYHDSVCLNISLPTFLLYRLRQRTPYNTRVTERSAPKPVFYVPSEMEDMPLVEQSYREAWGGYLELTSIMDEGFARNYLPRSLYTEVTMCLPVDLWLRLSDDLEYFSLDESPDMVLSSRIREAVERTKND